MLPLLKILGSSLGVLSSVILTVCVAAIPWMLGGVIPLARLVLLAAAIVTAALSVLAAVLQGKLPKSIPLLLLPLIGIALLGLFQLRTESVSPIAEMPHTIVDTPSSLLAAVADIKPAASLSPSDTRFNVAMFLSLSLICLTSHQQFRTQKMLGIGSLILIINTVAVGALGLVKLFRTDGFFLNSQWFFNPGASHFATFVNPNNAAGWLCLGFSVSAGWLSYQLQRSSHQAKQKYGRLNTPKWEQIWHRTVNQLAELTPWQILWIVVVAFIGASVMATLSRGGILALVLGVAVGSTLKSTARKLPSLVLVLIVCGGGVYSLLHWLDLDNRVQSELETLQDIDTESDTRTVLWLNSLQAVRDFPICGTGLGSYKFAIMPYQSTDTRLWFRNAENQFVEMLVEGGLIGFAMFCLVGFVGIQVGRSGWRQRKNRVISNGEANERVSRRVLGAIGLAAMLATLTQAIAALFDFGIGLPATAAMLVLLLGACGGFLDQSESTGSLVHRISVSCNPFGILALQLSIIVAAAGFVSDLVNAADVDKSVVDSEKLLARPITAGRLAETSQTIEQLKTALTSRPDDSEGHRVLARLTVTEIRWQTLLSADPGILEKDDIRKTWSQFSLLTIVELLGQLQADDPNARTQLLDSFRKARTISDANAILRGISRTHPFIPGIAATLAKLAAIDDIPQLTPHIEHAVFASPANAGNAFRMGLLALRCQLPEKAKQVWTHSLQYSERYRSAIMQDAVSHWDAAEVMQLFGPETYDECVQAASSARSVELRDSLWTKADQLWESLQLPLPEETCLLRTTHLIHLRKQEDAISWLEECLKQPGDNLLLSRRLAPLLETSRRYRDAVAQWNRILYLHPNDASAAAALNRINELKRSND